MPTGRPGPRLTPFLRLCWQLARRDVLGRYRGTALGLGWSVLLPVATLAVYTFVFRDIFQARWPTGGGDGLGFALRLYAGLAWFGFVAEVLSRAPRLVIEQPNLVKKVVFPLEALAVAAMSSALFHLAINLLLLSAGALWLEPGRPSLALLPVVGIPLALGLTGVLLGLAAVGVYLRDVGQAVGVVVSALMFLSPVFYPLSAVPERWQPLYLVNPLTLPIEATRALLFGTELPGTGTWIGASLAGLAILAAGYALFRRVRPGFADFV